MLLVTIFSSIFLGVELAFVVLFFVLARKRKRLISKNTIFWFLPVLLFLFCLYLMAHIHKSGGFLVVGFLTSISAALKSFAFEINTGTLETVLNINVMFSIAFYFAYFLAALTVIGTFLSLTKDYLLNLIALSQKIKKTCDIVIGYNESSLHYINQNPNQTILWANEALSSDQKKFLYDNDITFISGALDSESFIKKGFKLNVRYNFITFESQESDYQILIDEFKKINKKGYLVFLYLEAKYQEMEVVRNQYLKQKDENPNLFIRVFSRYELIARKFVTNFTIPALLDNSFYNENKTIKEEKEINVIFYGFGKVNASLFTMFCQNNQLVGLIDNKLVSKPVNYYVFDKNEFAVNDKRINYLMRNFDEFEKDFEVIEKPCNFNTLNYDINSYEATSKIKEITNNKNSYNIIFVSYGSDYENAETAIWLKGQLNAKNTKIVARLKKQKLNDDSIVYFGNELAVINHLYIVNEELQQLAKDIDGQYSKLFTLNELDLENYWDNLSQIELYSNYYSAMNIKFKLNLMGLDLTKDEDAVSITMEEFMAIYHENENNNLDNYQKYFDTSLRNVIAYSEKLRWNAFYLFNGYRPMPAEMIKITDSEIYRKDHAKRLHACLISHQGLDSLHNFLLKHPDNKGRYSLNDIDFYKYDYMCFDNPNDNLIEKLFEKGYKIIKNN